MSFDREHPISLCLRFHFTRDILSHIFSNFFTVEELIDHFLLWRCLTLKDICRALIKGNSKLIINYLGIRDPSRPSKYIFLNQNEREEHWEFIWKHALRFCNDGRYLDYVFPVCGFHFAIDHSFADFYRGIYVCKYPINELPWGCVSESNETSVQWLSKFKENILIWIYRNDNARMLEWYAGKYGPPKFFPFLFAPECHQFILKNYGSVDLNTNKYVRILESSTAEMFSCFISLFGQPTENLIRACKIVDIKYIRILDGFGCLENEFEVKFRFRYIEDILWAFEKGLKVNHEFIHRNGTMNSLKVLKVLFELRPDLKRPEMIEHACNCDIKGKGGYLMKYQIIKEGDFIFSTDSEKRKIKVENFPADNVHRKILCNYIDAEGIQCQSLHHKWPICKYHRDQLGMRLKRK